MSYYHKPSRTWHDQRYANEKGVGSETLIRRFQDYDVFCSGTVALPDAGGPSSLATPQTTFSTSRAITAPPFSILRLSASCNPRAWCTAAGTLPPRPWATDASWYSRGSAWTAFRQT